MFIQQLTVKVLPNLSSRTSPSEMKIVLKDLLGLEKLTDCKYFVRNYNFKFLSDFLAFRQTNLLVVETIKTIQVMFSEDDKYKK